ncbi:hypothetical protein C8R41DRAFT_772469 [Lentinula lateritia]|uniref:LysM domain-containing protein n=1 Tax=Lentinula lateritia TaxID=40482 RepID=A0ABQ8V7K8_9AGAR|nr:hypothetical protein C8R41DRAFT_772469 [Lentinula lateritia]
MSILAGDSNLSLCLACSSSLPPRSHDPIFTTQCCKKPICYSCVSGNPRLARYNPCLACLGGVQAVGLRRHGGRQQPFVPPEKININGAVRDEDTFVLGEDDEDDEDLSGEGAPPPPYPEQTSSKSSSPPAQADGQPTPQSISSAEITTKINSSNYQNSSQYYIQRGDTVHGIALRFGVDGRELCRLNKLPPSTLSTTPHLLHTRTALTLPAFARLTDQNGHSLLSSPPDDAEERLRAVRRARERAEKHLQIVTKEVDWRVAKAYIALAEEEAVEDSGMQYDLKKKELGTVSQFRNAVGGQASNVELRALDMYFEDDEWEVRARRERRTNKLSYFLPS